MFVDILRTTRFAFQHISRSWWLSLITVFVLVLTTFSITLVAGLNIVGQRIVDAVEEKVNIDFYFFTYVKEDDILEAQTFLRTVDGVDQVIYVSQEEALEQFQEEHANDPAIIASIAELEDDEDILPASLIVRAENIGSYQEIIDDFAASPYNDLIDRTDFSDNQELITNLNTVVRRGQQIGIGVSAIFVVIAVIVIFNTMRITIYSHREEMAIMKLVGATNTFIRAPYIIEAAILGLIAAAITVAVFSGILIATDATVRDFFTGYNFSLLTYVNQRWVEFVLVEVIGAILFSVLASMTAITRHLRV